MPRARSKKTYQQTTAAQNYQGGGCLSGFTIVPLTVIFIISTLTSLVLKSDPIYVDVPPDSKFSGLAHIFRPEVLFWANSISDWAAGSNLNPNLVATIMQIESCGDPRALSSAGAMGLFQVMPFHFHTTDDPYNPNTNALRGLSYLSRSLEAANGDTRLAMAGYNGGISLINHAEWTWPNETKRYVQFGAPIYEDAINNLEISPAVNDWYTSYGVSLCQQARQRIGLQ